MEYLLQQVLESALIFSSGCIFTTRNCQVWVHVFTCFYRPLCIFSPVQLQWCMRKKWSQESDSVSERLCLYSQNKSQIPPVPLGTFPSLACLVTTCWVGSGPWRCSRLLPSVCLSFPSRSTPPPALLRGRLVSGLWHKCTSPGPGPEDIFPTRKFFLL